MSLVEELFKQNPFIYYIKGKYYAMGWGVCLKCGESSVLLKPRYDKFVTNIDCDLTQKEAWKLYHSLMVEADCAMEKVGFCNHPEKELVKLNLGKEEMEELENQIIRNQRFWKNNRLWKMML